MPSQANALLDELEMIVGRTSPGDVLNLSMARAERAISRLRASSCPKSMLMKFEGRLGHLKGLAMDRLLASAQGTEKTPSNVGKKGTDKQRALREFSVRAAEKNAKTAREALTKPSHWAHETFKKELFRTIGNAEKIPDAYKENLLRDTAMLLQVCPEAGGLVAAMTTRGQPRRTFSERLATKGNDAIGAAYEIMGTAALCERESRPSNQILGAPSLRIDPSKDRLVFGAKAYLNHKHKGEPAPSEKRRRSIECDAQYQKDGREIGIDFKHTKDGKRGDGEASILYHLNAITDKLLDGEIDEYHFVTNGEFSDTYKRCIDQMNDQIAERNLRVSEGTHGFEKDSNFAVSPISYHENVTTLSADPLADGQAE